MNQHWSYRSLPLLAIALIVLALGLFVEWPGWWSALFGIAGFALLSAWALGHPKRSALKRRSTVQRSAERRSGRDRRVIPLPD